MGMRLRTWTMASVTALVAAAFPAAAHAQPSSRPLGSCRAEVIQPTLASNVHIELTALRRTLDAQSSYCQVSGYIDEGSRIGFVLGLPAKWNGKFLFVGIGGFGGVTGSIDAGLAQGYATASTDTGHKGSPTDDASWALGNRPAVVNHFQRGVPLAVDVTKAITETYYEKRPNYSYFDGCSGGGRQALWEAEKFPEQFDGILAGAPAWNYTKLMMTMVENTNYMVNHPKGWIPEEKFAAIDAEVVRQCDAADGINDGMLADPRQCRPNLKKLLCTPQSSGKDCLTADQVGALEFLSRPRTPAEQKVGWAGFPLTGSESNAYGDGMPRWKFGSKPPIKGADGRVNFPSDGGPLQLLGTNFLRNIVRGDPSYDYHNFSVDKDGQQLESEMTPLTNADQTDIAPFVQRGGKLLIWHGWSDPAIPAEMSIDLYGRIRRDTKAIEGKSLDQSVRLFVVPGLQHCQWGSGLTEFNRISALERWVEKGEAPDQLFAEQVAHGSVTRSRPICAFPKVAHYKGAGDINDAVSFECSEATH